MRIRHKSKLRRTSEVTESDWRKALKNNYNNIN